MKTIETLRPHTPPSPEQIIAARIALNLPADQVDPVLIAFQWLDAQLVRENRNRQWLATKHLIENWAGCYVSADDVAVAAHLHPLIKGEYPGFNLSSRRVWPHTRRLVDIASAGSMDYKETSLEYHYSLREF
ncbi:hypothetical protein KABACHOK_01810 [Brevundimonas phage vB_BpoS-Kabachok]|uniref:Uncharacterized protein n=1 Tax=Brevundimonas phage vB_BpoS-Kabachok TaxID=2948600 RepID=A0A9E7MQJ4_9CAUD|nr:hypothetical protein KABACHOK_01810 [Brevundimonas phage vB_BpoS-Kabachok]